MGVTDIAPKVRPLLSSRGVRRVGQPRICELLGIWLIVADPFPGKIFQPIASDRLSKRNRRQHGQTELRQVQGLDLYTRCRADRPGVSYACPGAPSNADLCRLVWAMQFSGILRASRANPLQAWIDDATDANP